MRTIFRKKIWKYIGILGIGLLLVYLSAKLNDQHNEKIMYKQLSQSLSDTLTQVKKENETFVYTISSLEIKNAEYFKKLKIKDIDIQALQEKIDQYTKSAAIVKIETRVDTIFVVVNDSGQPLFNRKKEFAINFEDWVQSIITIAPPDSLGLKISVKNDFIIQHKKDEFGRMYVEVQDKNPYSITKSLRSYYQQDLSTIDKVSQSISESTDEFINGTSKYFDKPRKKRFGIGPSVGYGLMFSEKSYHNGFYIGIGVNYSIFNF